MLIDDLIHEARRLQASLRAMGVDRVALEEADLLCRALGHDPIENVLPFAVEALKRIDDHLPAGTLAGLVRVRIRSLVGTLQELGKKSDRADTAGGEKASQKELAGAARSSQGYRNLSPSQTYRAEMTHRQKQRYSGGELPDQAAAPFGPAATKQG